MGVVLLELAHPGQPAEHAGRLVAVQHVLGVQPHRQLAVAALLHLIEQVVRRAVHRLERERRALVLGQRRIRLGIEDQEHVLAVLAPVAALLPQHLVVEQRRLDLDVAVGQAHPAHRGLQHREEDRAVRGPEHGARRGGVEREQVELLAELSVVALARLLLLVQPGVEILLGEERGAVDPLELGVAVIAAPVRAGDRQELDHADPPGRRAVRAEAEVDPVAVRVQRQRPGALGEDVLDDLQLELLAEPAEQRERLVARDLLAGEREVLLDLLVGRLLDRLEVLGRERLVAREVVVEAVLGGRPDRHLGAGEQPLDDRRDDMRGVVAHQVEPLGVLRREHRERAAVIERLRQVDVGAVVAREQRGLGQPGADLRADEVGDRRAGRHVLVGSVGQGDRDVRGLGHGPRSLPGLRSAVSRVAPRHAPRRRVRRAGRGSPPAGPPRRTA